MSVDRYDWDRYRSKLLWTCWRLFGLWWVAFSPCGVETSLVHAQAQAKTAHKHLERPLRMVDLLIPRTDARARWSFLVNMQGLYPIQANDPFSTWNVPGSLGLSLVVYDSIKKIRLWPFAMTLILEQNGRANAFDTVSYAYSVGTLETVVHLHPYFHLWYDFSLLRGGSETHVSDAGLSGRLGFRIPFWFRDTAPQGYDRNALHLIVIPVSATLLGRPNLIGFEPFGRLEPALNVHLGLEGIFSLTSWLGLSFQAFSHLNLTQFRSLLLRGNAGISMSWGFFSMRLAMLFQWFPNAPPLRKNLYALYQLKYPSFGAELQIRFALGGWVLHPAARRSQ
ncbi:MAG: hypothetical protein AAGJ35_02085 [Myxococcota bacterium]